MWNDSTFLIISTIASVIVFGPLLWTGTAVPTVLTKAAIRQCLLLYGLYIAVFYGIRLLYLGSLVDLDDPTASAFIATSIGLVLGIILTKLLQSLLLVSGSLRQILISCMALLIVMLIYAFPLYRAQIGGLADRLSSGSIKTAAVEFSFTTRETLKAGVRSAAVGNDSNHPSAIPRPSDPRPGLRGLSQALTQDVTGYLPRDDRYIKYFSGTKIPKADDKTLYDNEIKSADSVLGPARALTSCLQAYVGIFPDPQLLVVDTKSVLQWLFRTHAKSLTKLQSRGDDHDQTQNILSLSLSDDDFSEKVNEVRGSIRSLLVPGISPSTYQPDDDWTKISDNLRSSGYTIDDQGLLAKCFSNQSNSSSNAKNLRILQPYLEIALADLVVAHGASDEGLGILTDWLEMWRCARGAHLAGSVQDIPARALNCEYGPTPGADKVAKWFEFRMEFELNVLFFQVAGETNLAYRDFLRGHAARFAEFVSTPNFTSTPPAELVSTARSRYFSLKDEMTRCKKLGSSPLSSTDIQSFPKDEQPYLELQFKTYLLRALLNNENTLLRTELNFFSDVSTVNQLEDFYERAQDLKAFSYGCLDPLGEDPSWLPYAYDFQITTGLVQLAVSDRLAALTGSADDLKRAHAIRTESKQNLSTGLRHLIRIRDAEREKLASSSLSERVFKNANWEQSCAQAEQALKNFE